MGEIHVDARLNIVELSGIAWAETVRRAAEATGSEADAAADPEYFPHPDAHHQDAGDELRRAGILDAQGTLSPQWILAVTLAVSAPLTATTVVQFQDQSIHSRAGLAGGRCVAAADRRHLCRPGCADHAFLADLVRVGRDAGGGEDRCAARAC